MVRGRIGEFDLIKRMTESVQIFSDHLYKGIGDDCAVIGRNGESDLLVTSDLCVEKVHFDRQWFLPEQIGSKALRSSLSDIAAMGGIAEYALVSLAVPLSCDPQETESIYRGIRETAAAFQVTLAGGDLSHTPGNILIDIMVLGKVAKAQAVLRSGGQPGDRIFVSGTLGEAALGFRILSSKETVSSAESLVGRQKNPEPRMALGQALGQGRWPSAMIDVSDGLSSDLGHLCKAGGVGARLRIDALPASDPFRRACRQLSLDAESLLLHGGEDYELLFTIPSGKVSQFQEEKFPVPVTEIGEIRPAAHGILIEFADGQCEELHAGGYDHFGQSS